MIKILKSNKLISSLLIILCIFFVIKPKVCSNSCLNAISVWALNILPVMLPFFILTRLIVEISTPKSNILDKFFSKAYNVPTNSLYIFFLSALSGYPMGAKLICSIYEQGKINKSEAKKMLSFCSISGPMFMIGTVGVAILKSYKAGLIILISNIIGALINGLFFRGKKQEKKELYISTTRKDNILSDAVYDSLNSILMVGGFIVFSFIIIDALKYTNILLYISKPICWVLNNNIDINVVQSILSGILEITRGIIELNSTCLSLEIKTIICSGLIGFGGICIMLQSLAFLKKLNLNFKNMLIQKLSQGIISALISFILVFIVF